MATENISVRCQWSQRLAAKQVGSAPRWEFDVMEVVLTEASGGKLSFFHRVLLLSIAFFKALAMSNPAIAESLKKPVLLREVLLRTQDDPLLKPWVVARTNDNGFIVAGSADMAAWAAKTDSQGNLIWDYVRGLQDQLRNPHPGEFHGAVSMQDGTTYLCGHMPRPPGSHAPWALLTHLDSSRRVLSEKFLPMAGIADGAVFDDCAQWRDGVAIVGHMEPIVGAAAPGVLPLTERSYRVLA